MKGFSDKFQIVLRDELATFVSSFNIEVTYMVYHVDDIRLDIEWHLQLLLQTQESVIVVKASVQMTLSLTDTSLHLTSLMGSSLVRLTLSCKVSLSSLILNFTIFFRISVLDEVPRRGRYWTTRARYDFKSLTEKKRIFHNLEELEMTIALRPSFICKLTYVHHQSHKKSASSPRSLRWVAHVWSRFAPVQLLWHQWIQTSLEIWLQWSWSRSDVWVSNDSQAEDAATCVRRTQWELSSWYPIFVISDTETWFDLRQRDLTGPKFVTDVLDLVLISWRLTSWDTDRKRDTRLSRVGVSSIQSRNALWTRGTPLLDNDRRRRVSCCPWLESHHALEGPQCIFF